MDNTPDLVVLIYLSVPIMFLLGRFVWWYEYAEKNAEFWPNNDIADLTAAGLIFWPLTLFCACVFGIILVIYFVVCIPIIKLRNRRFKE